MAYIRGAIQYNGEVFAKFDLTALISSFCMFFIRYVVRFPAPLSALSICCFKTGADLAISSSSFRNLSLLGRKSVSVDPLRAMFLSARDWITDTLLFYTSHHLFLSVSVSAIAWLSIV